jgi:XTP/dITP diphosphohydrolase
MNQLIFASANEHKVHEIRALFESLPFTILSLTDLNWHQPIPETATTLAGNALIKAKTIFDAFQMPCFADDTGLAVESLQGRPGVYSARYAGENATSEENKQKLLEELKGVSDRNARFLTCICLYGMGETRYFEGELTGEITEHPSGDAGFGYDAIFKPTHFDKTLAEMTAAEKNSISHRFKAIQALKAALSQGFGG